MTILLPRTMSATEAASCAHRLADYLDTRSPDTMGRMTFTVVAAGALDIDELVDLLVEMAAHYRTPGDPPPRAELAARTRAVLLGDAPAARVMLARDHNRTVVGMAAYTIMWPAAWAGTSAFLKDLFVREGHRGRGIGRLLIDHVRVAAAAQGCLRLDWTTDHDNDDARAFYKRLGAVEAGMVFYRDALQARS